MSLVYRIEAECKECGWKGTSTDLSVIRGTAENHACETIKARRGQTPVGRILWNERGKDIDEIVLHDVRTVHVEQMDNRCWWIGIDVADRRYWSGNFVADSRGRMGFMEQDNDGIEWDYDESHDEWVNPVTGVKP